MKLLSSIFYHLSKQFKVYFVQLSSILLYKVVNKNKGQQKRVQVSISKLSGHNLLVRVIYTQWLHNPTHSILKWRLQNWMVLSERTQLRLTSIYFFDSVCVIIQLWLWDKTKIKTKVGAFLLFAATIMAHLVSRLHQHALYQPSLSLLADLYINKCQQMRDHLVRIH